MAPADLPGSPSRVLTFLWYLPREEEGQGQEIHLAPRTATFRIQFVQRFFTGVVDLAWTDVDRCVLRQVPCF